MTIRAEPANHPPVTGSTLAYTAALVAVLVPGPALAQEGAADSTLLGADPPADSLPADSVAADSLPGDSLAAAADTSAAEGADAGPRGVPSLEGYRRIAIVSRDMAPAVRGDETVVEIHRGAEGAQVLRFVTVGTPWALVVRPAAGADSYTLRDFDCSGGFTEELEAGTPLTIPDCALPSAPAPAVEEDDD